MTQLRQSYVTGHTKKLRSLVFNPTTPNLLATCALDGYVKVWNLASAHSYATLSMDLFSKDINNKSLNGLINKLIPNIKINSISRNDRALNNIFGLFFK